MKPLFVSVLSLAAIAMPSFAFAATYQYVDMGGRVSSVTADNANAALVFTGNISPNSGVMLADGSVPNGMFVGL